MYIKRIDGEADPCKELLLSEPCAVALGNFDGLHKGHLSLIRKAKEYAEENNVKSCVFTFTDNISGSLYITSNEQREKILHSENIDYFIMQEFTSKFKHLTAQQFFQKYIVDFLKAKAVIAGFNYRFGYNGSGGEKELIELCGKNNIKLYVMPPVLYLDRPVSSTRIRSAVEKGNLKDAEQMLGREFSVMGKVIHGDKIGRTLGFPTANLEVDTNHVMPPKGVYASKTEVEGKIYNSITNYGGKPTIKKGIDLIETHILNYERDIYGQTIEVRFGAKIRDIKSFTDKDRLTAQLISDKHYVKEFLDKNTPLC